MNPEFDLVDKEMSWSDARRYCRENFLDLATVKNPGENQQVHEKAQSKRVWIGLHREPHIYWSDGTKYSFSNWASGMNPFRGMSKICAALTRSGEWKTLSCETRLPFVCYSLPTPGELSLSFLYGSQAILHSVLCKSLEPPVISAFSGEKWETAADLT